MISDELTSTKASLLRTYRRIGAYVTLSFVARGGSCQLILLTLPPVLLAAVLLIGPMQVYSAEMTWDLLFNLDGAWRIYSGQTAHVDFHTELGSLPFRLTALGFLVTGHSVLAVPVGECLFAAVVLALCILVARRRLPLLPAAIFATMCIFIVLMPMVYGDIFGAYSFAMAYNRFGWSLSCVLFLLLFVPPYDNRAATWQDHGAGFALMVLLFYIKVTYFAVAIAGLVLKLILPAEEPRIQTRLIMVLLGTALVAISPFNHAYLADIVTALFAGGVRTGIAGFFGKFLADPAEYALALAGCVLLTVLPGARATRRLRRANVAYALFMVASGPLLLSQNSQTHGLPTYSIICLMLYRAISDTMAPHPAASNDHRVRLLATLLAYPGLIIAVGGVSVGHYAYTQLFRRVALVHIDTGNIRRLVVPRDDFARFGVAGGSPAARIRPAGLRYELSQFEYANTIRDLSTLWEAPVADAPPRILVIDRVNAIPFVLGLPAPRGVDIWWGEQWGKGLVSRPGEEIFGDVDYVAIPRHSTNHATTCELAARYNDYLLASFGVWRDIPGWLVLRRRAATDTLAALPDPGVLDGCQDILRRTVDPGSPALARMLDGNSDGSTRLPDPRDGGPQADKSSGDVF